MFALTESRIDTRALRAELEDPACGAVVCFEGVVRNHHAGRVVRDLRYEAYRELAEREGERLVVEVAEQFGLQRVVAVHRIGQLDIGEIAVFVGVAAAHRDAAFAACRRLIDDIKRDIPIWKHEHYAEGDRAWIHPEPSEPAASIET